MNNDVSEEAPQEYPLTAEQIRVKRVQRDKDSLQWDLNALVYERQELMGEVRKAQEIFAGKMKRFSTKAGAIVQRERELLKRMNRILELSGKCSATSLTIVTRDNHAFHACELDYQHDGDHTCKCKSKFGEAAVMRDE